MVWNPTRRRLGQPCRPSSDKRRRGGRSEFRGHPDLAFGSLGCGGARRPLRGDGGRGLHRGWIPHLRAVGCARGSKRGDRGAAAGRGVSLGREGGPGQFDTAGSEPSWCGCAPPLPVPGVQAEGNSSDLDHSPGGRVLEMDRAHGSEDEERCDGTPTFALSPTLQTSGDAGSGHLTLESMVLPPALPCAPTSAPLQSGRPHSPAISASGMCGRPLQADGGPGGVFADWKRRIRSGLTLK